MKVSQRSIENLEHHTVPSIGFLSSGFREPSLPGPHKSLTEHFLEPRRTFPPYNNAFLSLSVSHGRLRGQKGIAKQLESVDDETIDGVARCCREPRTTTAGTGESPLPPSFLSYLSDTEKTLLLRQAPPLKRPSVGDGGGSSGHERRRGLQPRARKIVEDADDNAKPPSACDCSGTEGSVSIGRCADGSQTEPVPCSTLSV